MKKIDSQNLTICRLIKKFKNIDDNSIVDELFRIINNEFFRFDELSISAKNQAAKDYWANLEEEQQQELAWKDCLEFCHDTRNDDVFFNIKGIQQ